MNTYRSIIKPFLFLLSPETAHKFVFYFLKITLKVPGLCFFIQKVYDLKATKLEKEVFGIKFPNPVGLAAGFDKDATLYKELSCLGFGFIEVGTVTPKAQPGNPKPRMFRLPADEALINRMGFNNEGVEAMIIHLKKRKGKIIIGGNIGKNKNTANENAIDDYEICFRSLFHLVDYFVVNVSSPNTAGLRELQEKDPLLKILKRLQVVNKELSHPENKTIKPLLVKIAPDLTEQALDEIVEVCLEAGLDGIIATNTTISRENLSTSSAIVESYGAGGLSGKPLSRKSTDVIRYISKKSGGKLVIIGAGGIHSAEDAIEKIKAGASLVQVYTGFIYEGPALIRKINSVLVEEGL